MNRRSWLQTFAAFAALSGLGRAPCANAASLAQPAYGASEIPMFQDVAEARRATYAHFLADPSDPLATPDEVERILGHLTPQFWIGPAAGGDANLGATRLGGAPDLPAGVDWPRRAIPANAEAMAAALSERQQWIGRHIRRELPYEFLAQIDLAETGATGAAAGLPAGGRLLFFWDGVGGLMFEGPAWARVIWDDTPAERLRRLEIPAVMAELEKAYDPSGKYKKPYVYPSRAMRLEPILQLPDRLACEMLADEVLAKKFDEDLDFLFAYSQLLSGETGMRKRPDHSARRERFLGLPDPEQRDPRLQVIDTSDFPPGTWSTQTLRLAIARALEWRFLLQLDIADLAQDRLHEGTVYFVIRADDLARRDFSRVRAIYQVT